MPDEAGAEPSAGATYGVQFNQVRQQPGGPRRYGVVPSRVDCFQNRAVASELAETVATGAAAVLTGSGGTSVLSGLGGVGKTQLAADYAESVAGEVDLLVWITATSRQAILAGYAAIIADLTGFQAPGSEAPAERFLAYLAGADRWLVVLDDVQSPGDLRNLWPPTTATGRVVVTTRRRDEAMRGRNRRVIDVDTFTPAESLAFLQLKLVVRPRLLDGAAELAGDLGHLPLALGQAAAYMLDRRVSCAEYRERLAARGNSLESLAPEADSLPEDHREPVARTWGLSVRLANELRPVGLAKPLLELASVLDPNGIPGVVFGSAAVLAWLGGIVGREVGAAEARDALGCLDRLSLINHEPERHRAVRVHALVQRATRESLFEAQVRAMARCAADALVEVWPDIERDTELALTLRDNSLVLQGHAWEQLWERECHPLLFRTARSLTECGQVAASVAYLEELRKAAEVRLAVDHPDVLTIRHNLAYARGELGDLRTAVAELEALLADRIRILGAEDPSTLATRYNLAHWHGESGDPAAAVAELDALLVDMQRVLGPEHTESLACRHGRACWQGEAGRHAEAIEELGAILLDCTRIFGGEDPRTLTVRHELAFWRGEAGDPEYTVRELGEVLAAEQRILGPDHPSVLQTRHNIASWSADTRDRAEAVAALEAVLRDRTRVLGPDHPDTITTAQRVAGLRER